ncbi:MAG: sel1 repeat family protein [Deltaproteobacteria bacterium]|jgi:TPR repeat protein|nr:sel1 repeat family protein [Deltaproteobacteria bacterium]MBT4526619.1 sel1 repeat family protein [Deltaproteobacteria bacterium]
MQNNLEVQRKISQPERKTYLAVSLVLIICLLGLFSSCSAPQLKMNDYFYKENLKQYQRFTFSPRRGLKFTEMEVEEGDQLIVLANGKVEKCHTSGGSFTNCYRTIHAYSALKIAIGKANYFVSAVDYNGSKLRTTENSGKIVLGFNTGNFPNFPNGFPNWMRMFKGSYIVDIFVLKQNANEQYAISLLQGAVNANSEDLAFAQAVSRFKDYHSPKESIPVAEKSEPKPKIAISSHKTTAASQIVEAETTSIKGSVSGNQVKQLYINDNRVSISSAGKFESNISLKIGSNDIFIKAIDKNGNVAEETFNLIRIQELKKTNEIIFSTYKENFWNVDAYNPFDNNEKLSSILETYQTLLKNGSPKTEFVLADIYYLLSEHTNPKLAFSLAQKAASNDEIFGKLLLAKFLYVGYGGDSNKQKANDLLQNILPEIQSYLNEHEDADKERKDVIESLASYFKGWIYNQGTGVTKNPNRAFNLYKQAAESGYLPAQYNIGLAYLRGVGTEKDIVKAESIIGKFAAAGFKRAQSNLVWMYKTDQFSGEYLNRLSEWYKLDEDTFWKATKRYQTLDNFKRYLTLFPNGKFVTQARAEIQRSRTLTSDIKSGLIVAKPGK